MSTLFHIPFVPDNFHSIANKILNYTVLMINNNPHRICEIEFYLNSSEHRDLYVHGHDDQTKNGTWYFHRFNNGTYKNGTFKGLDIVFGFGENFGVKEVHTGDDRAFAAVLIRSIANLNERKLIEGPCNTVNHILALTGFDSVLSFTENQSLNILNNKRGLIIVEGKPEKLEPISYAPRIGLSNKYPEYQNKKYRFVIGPVKKEKKKLIPLITQ